ncbi:probable serine/threonine-protein kinase At1g01540 [Spinacia oleracea]|uniref:non-specific serine/threonine protein kinase n=1 Tax=Spinacia oleracea TaxID=3562 RepID=A0ABM3RNN2_SPIOL|nr:probable serine/threonine-protein kinase At1g01540 [Spinacia oleracea]
MPPPLECGVIKQSDFCGKEMEDFRIMRQYYSRLCCWFSMREILEATDNFHGRNLIGVGCYGKVYRGFLVDGTPIAVKELCFTSVKKEQFRRIVEAIPIMTHKNLVKLIGFCVEEWDLRTRYILVSEYVDNGNLHELLHENDVESISPLTWRIRMDIISGIAKGLAYLHEDVGQKIAHKKLQSHQILLDRQWNPKISDFVVARLDMNEKEDVYGFGILVLEIVSGRKPDNYDKAREEELLIWLKSMVLIKDYKQVIDSKIPQQPPLKELKRVILTALRCVDPDTQNRPKMGEVIHMLEPRDLLLSDGKDVYRQSFSLDSQDFSRQLSIKDHVSDYDLRDDDV